MCPFSQTRKTSKQIPVAWDYDVAAAVQQLTSVFVIFTIILSSLKLTPRIVVFVIMDISGVVLSNFRQLAFASSYRVRRGIRPVRFSSVRTAALSTIVDRLLWR